MTPDALKLTVVLHLALLAGAARAAQPAAATQPASVTLHLRDASPRALVDALSKQAGVPLPLTAPDLLDKGGIPPATIDLDRQPFWVAMREVGRKTGLEPFTSPDDPYPLFRLTTGGIGGGGNGFWDEPHVICGPVVLFANDVQRTHTIEFGKRANQHRHERDLTVNLTAFVEPGLRVVAASRQATLRFAVDENGRALKPPIDPDADGDADGPQPGVYSWNLGVELDCPATAGKTIARLAGRITLRVVTASQRVEFDDVLKARNVSRPLPVGAAGASFTLKSLKRADDEYHLQFQMRRGDRLAPPAWRDLHQSAYQGQMQLVDAQGRVVAARATEQGGEYGANKVEATLRFPREPGLSDPGAGEPHKLIWLAPTAARDLPVDFELKDLPIPE